MTARIRLPRPAVVASAVFNAVCYVFLALPAVVVVAASFSSASMLSFPPRGFTLSWYAKTLADPAFMSALRVSVELAFLSTGLALALGLPAGYALARYRFRGRELAQSILMSPLVVPAVVFAIGLLQLLTVIGLARSMVGLVVGHVVITLPYVVRNMTAAFVLLDPSLEQAARNLRATPFQVIRRVTLPVMLPSVLSSAVFAFVTSFGNLTVSIFLGGPGHTTLPVQIFAYVDQSLDPMVAAVSTIVILITLAVVFLVERLVGLQRIV